MIAVETDQGPCARTAATGGQLAFPRLSATDTQAYGYDQCLDVLTGAEYNGSPGAERLVFGLVGASLAALVGANFARPSDAFPLVHVIAAVMEHAAFLSLFIQLEDLASGY